jgi:hypothetical protein
MDGAAFDLGIIRTVVRARIPKKALRKDSPNNTIAFLWIPIIAGQGFLIEEKPALTSQKGTLVPPKWDAN